MDTLNTQRLGAVLARVLVDVRRVLLAGALTARTALSALAGEVGAASGAHAGTLYAGFYAWTGTFITVEVASSANGGGTWGTPVRVTRPATRTTSSSPGSR